MERKPVVIAQEELAREAAVCGEIKAWWASRGRTPRAYVDTYGCQQNEADSERIRGMLRASGYDIVDTEEGADCIVINTCAIREHAETRVYGNVGALVHTKARHPEQKIFLCGCMMGQPQVVERIKNSYRHVDGVFNPHELWRFPELLQRVLKTGKRIFAVDDSAGNIAEGIPVVRSSNLKAWVSIMYGCNNFCSYCIVPYVRGRERSRRPEEILEEVKGLIAAAFLLFALTYGGGQFRLYLFLAVGLTAILYFLTLSPAVVRLFQALFSLLGRFVQVILTPARFFLKFLKKILKTLFARCRKWFTMTCKHISDWKHAQLERSRRRNEVRQVVSAGQAGDSDPRCVRYCYPGAPSLPDQREGRRGKGAHKLHRKHAAGK